MMTTKNSADTLAETILESELLSRVHARASKILQKGLSAGSRYPEVWIRDLATFIEVACAVGDPADIRQALLDFLDFQQPDGGIVDGYTKRNESIDPYKYILCKKHPERVGHKNTVETDQESSLVSAVRRYVEVSGDDSILEDLVDGISVLDRLEQALEWIYRERWSAKYGLAWNDTTIDWGDVQPNHSWGVELDESSHPAMCIYTNAMLSIAIRDFIWLEQRTDRPESDWEKRRAQLHASVRRHLWDAESQKFRPHVYLEKGSPFPDFDETPIFYHGGTAVAILAGILSKGEVIASAQRMFQNVKEAGARSVGLTIWPLYNVPTAVQPNYRVPFVYQNGGDWPWWGGRVAMAFLASGLPELAWEALLPIVKLADEHGFHEWHGPDGTPHGAENFRGGAGVVALAIEQMQSWAKTCS